MPKQAASDSVKISNLIKSFPGEFSSTPKTELFCLLCQEVVKFNKRHFVESHRKSGKHTKRMSQNNEAPMKKQQFINFELDDFGERVTKAFVSSNIPLHKLRCPSLRALFTDIGHPLPSESTCRNSVQKLVASEENEMKTYFNEKKVVIYCDEAEVNGVKYLHVLMADIEREQKIFLTNCKQLECPPNSAVVSIAIDDAVKQLNIQRENVVLLVSDAASYMAAAGVQLKHFYPNMFHVFCVAHLLHNCGEKIRGRYDAVDDLIARIKTCVLKNGPRRHMFSAIGTPPQPIVTRWGSWVLAALYYAKNLPQVKLIVEGFEDDGMQARRAKESVRNGDLPQQLMEISRCYAQLPQVLDQTTKYNFTIRDAEKMINDLDFEEDPVNLKDYIQSRMKKNDLKEISQMKKSSISPSTYNQILNCHPTGAPVERSFSMLNKLLTKDRNFLPENVPAYMRFYFNKFS